jgi:DNA replication and repair protein RecF
MRVEGLELTNFRSYARAGFELHPDMTLVVGPNASGKTNLLESLYVLAVTKSFRAKDRELVRHGEDHFRVAARAGDVDYALGMSLESGAPAKKITHDEVKRTTSGHVGTMQLVLFEPTDLELVAGPPEGRRRYLDFLLCQTDPAYMKTLQQYRRVLKQRNALLDGFEVGAVRDQVFTWDVKMAELAVEIYERRQRLLGVLNREVPKLYAEIAGEELGIELDYVPSVAGDYALEFLETLARNLPRDLGAGFTTIGPHREDFKVRFRNNDITAVASRGEVRTVVLALKLAELEYDEAETGVRPVLLLDDVFSELDRERRGFLLNRLGGHQTIITTTDADAVTREFATPHKVISTEALARSGGRHA